VDWAGLKLGKVIESRLGSQLPIRQSSIVAHTRSTDGTVKLLVGFAGGGAVESVLMPAYDGIRAAGCISSQIGCAMRCDFCASTRRGLERNLEPGEIVEQFLHLRQEARLSSRRLATIVFMGMGEPMQNLPNVIRAIRRIASPEMGELGGRQITVSTVGIVPGIDALAEADLNVHLAVSLHAPDDVTRSRIIPMNRRYGVAEIMAAARRFQERTGRIVTIEYCLLDGVNDSDVHAHTLADLLSGFRAHVNLIPYNPIGAGLSGTAYATPPASRVQSFYNILFGRGVVVHLRHPRGNDVNAACGQLRETTIR
jgi:23S rRNA (adenine2503-C2)-methyltransferase